MLGSQRLADLIIKGLNIAGVDLEFTGFSIKGIPGFDLQVMYRGVDSFVELQTVKPSFKISAVDYTENAVAIDAIFFMEDTAYRHSFKVLNGVPDLIGWVELNCDYEGSVVL